MIDKFLENWQKKNNGSFCYLSQLYGGYRTKKEAKEATIIDSLKKPDG